MRRFFKIQEELDEDVEDFDLENYERFKEPIQEYNELDEFTECLRGY